MSDKDDSKELKRNTKKLFLLDNPDHIGKLFSTEQTFFIFLPPKKDAKTRCPIVPLLDCGAFFITSQEL